MPHLPAVTKGGKGLPLASALEDALPVFEVGPEMSDNPVAFGAALCDEAITVN